MLCYPIFSLLDGGLLVGQSAALSLCWGPTEPGVEGTHLNIYWVKRWNLHKSSISLQFIHHVKARLILPGKELGLWLSLYISASCGCSQSFTLGLNTVSPWAKHIWVKSPVASPRSWGLVLIIKYCKVFNSHEAASWDNSIILIFCLIKHLGALNRGCVCLPGDGETQGTISLKAGCAR